MKLRTLLPAAALSLIVAPGIALAQQTQTTPRASSDTTTTTSPSGTTTKTTTEMATPRYMKVDDMHVVGGNGEKIGEISEVLIDSSGKIVAVAVEAGGFLGMGDRDVVVQLDQLRFQNNQFVTSLTKEQMKDLPEWKD